MLLNMNKLIVTFTAENDSIKQTLKQQLELMHSRDAEIGLLKKALSDKIINNPSYLDPQIISATTERYEFYLTLVTYTIYASAAIMAVWYLSFFFVTLKSPFLFISETGKSLGQRFGYFQEVESYYRNLDELLFEIKIFNKKNITMNIKYPNSGGWQEVFLKFKEYFDLSTIQFQNQVIDLAITTSLTDSLTDSAVAVAATEALKLSTVAKLKTDTIDFTVDQVFKNLKRLAEAASETQAIEEAAKVVEVLTNNILTLPNF